MEKLTFKVKDLVKKVRTGRDLHKLQFDQDYQEYRSQILDALDRLRNDIINGKEFNPITIHVEKPIDNIKEFDRVLVMLEMCKENSITFSENEFKNYVMNQWDWHQRFTHITIDCLD